MALSGGNVSNSSEEILGAYRPNPVWCERCAFSRGGTVWEDAPDKAYCRVYTREIGIIKPASVLYGAECSYFVEG